MERMGFRNRMYVKGVQCTISLSVCVFVCMCVCCVCVCLHALTQATEA